MTWNECCLKAIRQEKAMGSKRYVEEVRGCAFEDKAPWILRRVEKGNPRASCSVCKQPIYDNVDVGKIITCAHCVQGLSLMAITEKSRLRDALIQKGDLEGARSVESFIPDDESKEEVILDGGKTKKFRPSVDGKGSLSKVRPQNRQGSFIDAGLLDQSRIEMR